jgi:hypothetical protein
MGPEKIHAIQDWEPPSNLEDVHAFMGFANFYHQFVHNYSCIFQPLTFLTQKGIPLTWMDEQQMAFDTLKHTCM